MSMCPDCGRPLTATVITDVPCSKLATECGAHVHPAWAEECQERTVAHLRSQLAQQSEALAAADRRRCEARQLLRRAIRKLREWQPQSHLAAQLSDYLNRTAEPNDVLRDSDGLLDSASEAKP